MIGSVMGGYPVADTRAAGILGAALRDAGYSEDGVRNLLGDDGYPGSAEDGPVSERRLPRTPLATIVRACFLQLPVSTRDAVRAVGKRAVDAFAATGLAEVGDDVVPRVRILPIGGLLIASDDFPSDEDDPGYVAAYSPSSRICDLLTPRRRVARALDVGTGSGIQALMASRHARHVVATDVNERALAYAEINAALNGITNVECRPGSLFEPVAGERFDLITSNAPFVVSPENRFAYRDGGLEGDGLSEQIVRGAAAHLDDGGFATLVVSWMAADENALDERPFEWTGETGCDSWILPVWGSDPLDHAARWNAPLGDDADAFGEAIDAWTGYLERLGAHWVSEGAVLLHRRPGGRYGARVDEVDDETLDEAGDQIQRAFASRARLAELRKPGELLDARLSVAATLQLERELQPRRGRVAVVGASLQLAEGTNPTVDASAEVLELVASLDGRKRLGEVIQDSRLRREALVVCRELLELGALRFVT